jgi:calcineurin-like phosphoesterase family protein
MKTYIISDTHFSHFNIIKYCNRPFKTAEEMDTVMINNWKNTVKNKDTIWHLGDVAMGEMKDENKLSNLIHSLPGYKKLILGNHDKQDINFWREVGFDEVYPYPVIIEKFFILSHDNIFLNENYPLHNIHGHLHDKIINSKCYTNVSVECIGYKPIDLEELIKNIIEKNN